MVLVTKLSTRNDVCDHQIALAAYKFTSLEERQMYEEWVMILGFMIQSDEAKVPRGSTAAAAEK